MELYCNKSANESATSNDEKIISNTESLNQTPISMNLDADMSKEDVDVGNISNEIISNGKE